MRKEKAVTDKLKVHDAAKIKLPEVVRAELFVGCLKSNHPDRKRIKLNHVIAPLDWIPFSDDAVEHYATIRCDLERSGSIIGPNDLLIAATARALGAVMVTANEKEFSRVPGLVVENWSAV